MNPFGSKGFIEKWHRFDMYIKIVDRAKYGFKCEVLCNLFKFP